MRSSYSGIIVPYDGSELSNKALQAAVKLAAGHKQIPIHVLHVMKPWGKLETFNKNYEAV